MDESDESVNNKTTKEQWNIPFNQMLYIGDGLTDVPCMATLKKYNGQTLAVLRPDHEKSVKCALKLLEDGRVDNIAPADYSEGSRVDELVKEWLLKIKADNEPEPSHSSDCTSLAPLSIRRIFRLQTFFKS